MLDHSDFQDTDIPFEIPLPEKAYLTVSNVILTGNLFNSDLPKKLNKNYIHLLNHESKSQCVIYFVTL